MMWDFPVSVEIDGEVHEIENECDYRVVLDCLSVYEDPDIDVETRHKLAFFIFYKNPKQITDVAAAIKEMLKIINFTTDEPTQSAPTEQNAPQLMMWSKDFKFIAPAVSRVLGYDVRTPGKYTHWWTFLGAYMEIGECTWGTFIAIRSKLKHGKKLEEWERAVYNEHKKDIDLPFIMSTDDSDWLNEL